MLWYRKFIDVRNRRGVNNLCFDFQINLAKAFLSTNPTSIKALQMLGNALTRAKKYKDALEVDEKIVRLLPNDPIAHYNLACDHSLLGDNDKAIESLGTALSLGYKDISFLFEDADLRNVRTDKRFKDIVLRYVTKMKNTSKKLDN